MSTNYGRCDCENIEYEFQDDPINTVFCYCRTCQLHTNSDKWFGVWVPFNKFKFIKGTPSSFTAIGDSGKETHRLFCGECATPIGLKCDGFDLYSLSASTRSKEAKHYGLKCLSTPLLPLIGLLFLKEFKNMTLSRPADK